VTADLAAWLLADDGPIAEDERVARAAIDGGPEDDGVWHRNHYCVEGAGIQIYDEGGHSEEQAEHIATWHPARVLAECAAKRAIVEGEQRSAQRYPDYAGSPATWHATRLLAQLYAGRPGWREEWGRVDQPTDIPPD
jgi:hypothetical protein